MSDSTSVVSMSSFSLSTNPIMTTNFRAGAPMRSLRVFVVDDIPDVADTLALLLSARGHHTQVAYGSQEALETILEFSPDAAFVDLGMPGKDGFQVAVELRSMFVNKPLLLVSISGWGSEVIKAKSKASGFDWHLIKPATWPQLEAVLSKVQ